MTFTQKAVFAGVLVAATGAGGYQAYRASHLKTQAELEEKRQQPDLELNMRLLDEWASITNLTAAVRQENKELRRQLEEISRLRVERDELQKKARDFSQIRIIEPDSIETEMRSWVDKTKVLQQRFNEWPGKPTPEIVLLSEQDWLDVARQTLNTDEDFRLAMSEVRYAAKEKFAGMLQGALREFTNSSNHEYPSELSLLKPYLNLPQDSPILEGYEIAQPGTVRAQLPGTDEIKAETWAIVEKGEPSDKDYDGRIVIYQGGRFGHSPARPVTTKQH